jgi:COMPASS component SPP1
VLTTIRCDEWYHTACVNVPDLEVDLIDQFFCPPCVESQCHLTVTDFELSNVFLENPQADLQTTYKQRCLYGLESLDPSSVKACHKPSRGIFSKYCSDTCGLANMRQRIENWSKKGGDTEHLWANVKDAERREGVVFRIDNDSGNLCHVSSEKRKADREADRLHGVLDGVVKLREELRKGMEVITLRERLLELAMARAENFSMCGWDQRLCFGDEEWTQYGEGVLESYEHASDSMQVDGHEQGQWWCSGEKECQRHKG